MVAKKDFEIGDLVWAKMKSYPFWPAKIVDPPTDTKSSTPKKAKHYVFFFGSKNCAWILDENIVHHSEEMLNKVTKKKSSSYIQAIDEIVEASGSVAAKPKPVKEDSVKNDESAKKSTPVQSPEKMVKTSSVKSEDSPKKSPVIRSEKRSRIKKIKQENEKPKKTHRKRSLSEDTSDQPSSPVAKLIKSDDYSALISNTPPNISFNRIAMIRPMDDRSMNAREYYELPPGPPIDMSKASQTLTAKNIKPTSKKIGFIGLGMMGQRMVKNLLVTGHDVSIWNRSPEKCKIFVDFGAHQYLTPADVVWNCDIIFCCVSGPEAAKSLVFGNWGVLQGLEKCKAGSKGYVEMTSVDPITSQEIAEAITFKGGKYLEAPISGSRALADEGSLLILCAGDSDLFKSCESCFFALSKNTYYLSDGVGSGSKMNLTLSMLMGTTYAALGEAMALIERCNLSKSNFLEILDLGPMACPLLSEKGHSIVAHNFLTDTSLKYQQKDMNLALTLGDKCEQPLVLTSAANELYKHAKLLRYSEHDVSAVYLGAKY
ncbi:putative oxidoreductase GLYR1 homolog [Nephila pilipes]|uniref:Cytokine-like nuclear factor N-PAC n=1 Tax=Nephila pilipes TaxID=299642 RepID=A0A8X6NVS0_NEPPI|nr:putative oxidoreductase GLYR1 homolog [Nephila pilipes]